MKDDSAEILVQTFLQDLSVKFETCVPLPMPSFYLKRPMSLLFDVVLGLQVQCIYVHRC